MKKEDSWLSIALVWIKFIVGSYVVGLISVIAVREAGAELADRGLEAHELTILSFLVGFCLIALFKAISDKTD